MNNYELSIAKILLDHPEKYEDLKNKGISSQNVTEPFLSEILASCEDQSDSNLKKLTRASILTFMNVERDEKEEFEEALVEVDNIGAELANYEAYCEHILDAIRVNTLRNTLSEATLKLNQGETSDKVISFLSSKAEDIQSIRQEVPMMKDLFADLENYIEDNRNRSPLELFGLPSLDQIAGGDTGAGELILLAAGPKVGKSSLFNNICINMLENQEEEFAAISGEMNGRTMFMRSLAGTLGISSKVVGSEYLLDSPDVKVKYEVLREKWSKRNSTIQFDALSIPSVERLIHFLHTKYGISVFLIDRIGLFAEASSKDEFRGRRTVTKALRILANKLNVKIIACSQIVNLPAKEGKRPLAHHVFGGNGGQADPTSVWMINRPYHVNPDITEFPDGAWKGYPTMDRERPGWTFAEIYCVLNNNGPSNGTALVAFAGPQQRFYDLGLVKHSEDKFNYDEHIKAWVRGDFQANYPDEYFLQEDPETEVPQQIGVKNEKIPDSTDLF